MTPFQVFEAIMLVVMTIVGIVLIALYWTLPKSRP